MGYFTLRDNSLTFERLLSTLLSIKDNNPVAANLDDLIYSFLLQSDFPRASIILDLDLLGSAAQVDTDIRRPSFIIADPLTAELLAVIDVVDDINGDALRQVAIETGAYASRLGGRTIQGFVIRVDVRGSTEAEQIQFYRIWPNSTLQQLSSKSFPDLDTLRVARKLVVAGITPVAKATPVIIDEVEGTGEMAERLPIVGMYIPAFVLLILVIVDSIFASYQGVRLLTVSQSVLAFGAALLFTLPAVLRYLRVKAS